MWKSHVEASSQLPYIQWETVTDTVFERIGERSFQGEAFRNRVDVPKEMLEEGNCSLFFTDVQFGDAGIYESYLVVGQSSIKKRIFLQSVQLLVFGEDLFCLILGACQSYTKVWAPSSGHQSSS